MQTAVADGETRAIKLHHLHTGEDITIIYKKDGQYLPSALNKLDWFLRDWRENKETHMDPRLYDLLWEVFREVGGSKPIQIVCGYRDEHTNAMLRQRSRGVAKFSQHMLGKAIDFFIPDVSLEKERVVGLRLQRGGVGYYPTSGSPFVHMDVGGIRHWPRMTRAQLLHVFPDGRTVHIPSDGRPLKNYALALVDVARHGSAPSQMSLATAENAGVIDDAEAEDADSGDDEEADPARPHLRREATAEGGGGTRPTISALANALVRVAAVKQRQIETPTRTVQHLAKRSVPLPKQRPAQAPVVVATALTAPMASVFDARFAAIHRAAAASVIASAAMTPSQIVEYRGYWQGLQDSAALNVADASDRAATGSITGTFTLASAETRQFGVGTLAYAAASARDMEPEERHELRQGLIAHAAEITATAALTVAHAKPMVQSAPDRFNPWLLAVMMTPSVRNEMSATQYGARDVSGLRRYLDKPTVAVTLAFSDDPYPDLPSDYFGGTAVVFLGTLALIDKMRAAPQLTAWLP